MPLYKVQIRGENFLLNLTGEPELLGFNVTHYVKADSEPEAQRIATILTRQNRQLHDHMLNIPQNPSRLECESIQRVWWRRASRNGQYRFWPVEEAETGTAD